MRLRRNEGGGGRSPSLRLRQISINSPFRHNKTSPPKGGINKKRRRVVKPKRVFDDNKKQLLITSSFSPRVTRKEKDGRGLEMEQEGKL